MRIPAPELFVNWVEWANALSAQLGPHAKRISGEQPTTLQAFQKTELPSATRFKQCLIYVTDETGGAVPAFSDGTNWRRVTDRAVVS